MRSANVPQGERRAGVSTDLEWCPRCMCCTTHVHDEDCPSCGGEGVVDAYDEDPLNADPGEVAHCGLCDGIGILEVSTCTCDSAGRHEP